MDIKVLGTGCTHCKNTFVPTDPKVKAQGVTVNLHGVSIRHTTDDKTP